MKALYEAASILMEGTNEPLIRVMTVLEDATSPITKKYHEKLFQSIIDRNHVDFGDIPKSRGYIEKYSGYKSMIETLSTLIALGKEEKCNELVNYATTVMTAIENIKKNKLIYAKAYTKKKEYITLEYQLYVYTCVEATTSLISAFMNDIQTSSHDMKITINNDKYRGNLFFIQSLEKFNAVNKNNEYTKYLNNMLNAGKENMIFDPATAVGIGAILLIAFSIIPITRKLIYYFKEMRRKISESLAMQAYFLELNKQCVEYNQTIDPKKKQKILKKQEKVRNMLLSLSDKFKVSDAQAKQASQRELDKDNKTMTIDGIRDEINDSDIEIV